MKQDKTVVAIVAGVSTNIGFTEEKRKQAGKQFVDVGIAEEHAVASFRNSKKWRKPNICNTLKLYAKNL